MEVPVHIQVMPAGLTKRATEEEMKSSFLNTQCLTHLVRALDIAFLCALLFFGAIYDISSIYDHMHWFFVSITMIYKLC